MNNPPLTYGKIYTLPNDLQFLFFAPLSNVMIVRMCYERVQSIITKKLTAPNRGSGLIFSGGQGNSKVRIRNNVVIITTSWMTIFLQTWLSLFIAWSMVYQGKTVIYEICEDSIVYMISPSGGIRVVAVPASQANVPELRDIGAVHIYDAKAKSRYEPAGSPAFLIEFTSRNSNNYAQTSRRHGMDRYCIPTYEVEELLHYCELFGVTSEEVLQRCAEIGPSMRYILVYDFETSKAHTIAVAGRVKAEQMDAYISNTLYGDEYDISACLVLAIVNEQDYLDPEDAYREENIKWELASSYLAKIIIDKASSNATDFVRKLITEVNSKGLTKMKGLVGNYFEVIVGKFLSDGLFSKTRRLVEPTTRGAFDETFRRMICWQKPLKIEELNINDVEKALLECTEMKTLYCFCKTFPAIDFATRGFTINFQATNSGNHSINLKSIRAICNHVRLKFGANAKVFLIFVVPEEIVCDANWRYTQSFCYYEEVELTEGVHQTRLTKRHSKLHALPEVVQEELSNLEQYVLCFK